MSNARRELKPVKSVKVKLKNKRVLGGLMYDDTILFAFRRLLSDRSVHTHKIRLTREAVRAMAAIEREL
jgi:hypothetical protein